jgi:hypothetical protein
MISYVYMLLLDQSVEYFLMKGVLNYIGSVDVRYLDGWLISI